MQHDKFVPLYFKDILDSKTGKMKIRMVDTESEAYKIASNYMIRLNKDDFEDPHELAKYATTVGISLKEFEKQFKYLISDIPLKGVDKKEKAQSSAKETQ